MITSSPPYFHVRFNVCINDLEKGVDLQHYILPKY